MGHSVSATSRPASARRTRGSGSLPASAVLSMLRFAAQEGEGGDLLGQNDHHRPSAVSETELSTRAVDNNKKLPPQVDDASFKSTTSTITAISTSGTDSSETPDGSFNERLERDFGIMSTRGDQMNTRKSVLSATSCPERLSSATGPRPLTDKHTIINI